MKITFLTTLLFSICLNIGNNSYADSTVEEVLRPTKAVDYLNNERLAVEQSKTIINDIINSKDLKGEKKSTEWSLKDLNPDKPDPDTPAWIKPLSVIFATIFEYTLWLLLFTGIVFLFLSRKHWLHLFSSEEVEEESYQAPDILFGMDVREASLPDDLIAEAQQLWQQKKARESLSLLYRGALVRLINQEQIALENSHTEGDILKLSQLSLLESKQDYLKRLTLQWQLIAYAHRIPLEEAMEWLFSHWHSHFAISSSAETKVNP